MERKQMNDSREYGGIDRFRLIAAFLIVGIHTGFIRVFARIAVPYFLLITGYFVLPEFTLSTGKNKEVLINTIRKIASLYALATLLYLPISIYAGHYSEGDILAGIVRNIIFDGTFYHLWYLPALIIGALMRYALSRWFSLNVIFGFTIILYIFGLLGDSYYGLTLEIPFLKAVYGVGFSIFSYTRNGLFYAPVFLAMGAVTAKTERLISKKASIIGFTISMLLMLAEGFTLQHFEYPRHDSMYIMLLPCMFFLFQLTLSFKEKASPFLRDTSSWLYIMHPLCIIGVRGVAKATGLTDLLIYNSMIHYLAVCSLSLATAVIITKLRKS